MEKLGVLGQNIVNIGSSFTIFFHWYYCIQELMQELMNHDILEKKIGLILYF